MKKQLHNKILIYVIFLFVAESTFSQATLLKDIYPGPESSSISYSPFQFNKLGNKLLFYANDGIHGNEYWITDGTTSGTIRVNDNFEDLNDTYYSLGGTALFKTNGTAAGTGIVMSGFMQANRLTNVNGTLFFVANSDSSNIGELWKSDGTTVGTVVVKKLRPNSSISPTTSNLIAASNGTDLLFTANDGTGMALWKSDGTTAGTIIVKYLYNTIQVTCGNFINFNGAVYFSANNSSNQSSLWKTDGTNSGTIIVYDNLNFHSYSDGSIIAYNNKLYFGAQSSQLWASDGTFAGTNIVYEYPNGYFTATNSYSVVNNILVFRAYTELYGYEYWKTDGSSNGTHLLKDVDPGTNSGILGSLGTFSELNKMFFTGYDGNQRMLWETDGTVAGTIPLYDISESDLQMITNIGYLNNKLIFAKETIAHGKELWSFNAPSLSNNHYQNRTKSKLYPNPVSSILSIENPFIGNLQLKVFNQFGQQVLKQNKNTSSTSLDVSNLSKGLYFLNITAENGNAETIKFIKN